MFNITPDFRYCLTSVFYFKWDTRPDYLANQAMRDCFYFKTLLMSP